MTRSIVCVALFAALGSGCATAPRELAEKTAANSGVLASSLKRLSGDVRTVAQLRAANVARLEHHTRQVRTRHEFDLALREEIAPASLTRLRTLERWIATVTKILEAKHETESEAAERLASDQVVLETHTKDLGAVGKALGELAKEGDFKTNAKFLGGYVKGVVDLVREKRKESEAAVSAAADLVREKPEESEAAAAAAAAENTGG